MVAPLSRKVVLLALVAVAHAHTLLPSSFDWTDPVSRELAQKADAAFADIVDDRIGSCTTRATRTDGSSLLYNTITISGLPFRALNACFTYVPVKGQIYPTFVAESDPNEPTLSFAVYFSGDLVNAADGSKIPVWAVSILKGEGYSKTVVNLCVSPDEGYMHPTEILSDAVWYCSRGKSFVEQQRPVRVLCADCSTLDLFATVAPTAAPTAVPTAFAAPEATAAASSAPTKKTSTKARWLLGNY